MAHNDLVKWLKSQLDDKEYKWLFISHETTQDYMAMIYECREASLIAFDGYIPLQHTVRYELTPAGSRALGIQATEGDGAATVERTLIYARGQWELWQERGADSSVYVVENGTGKRQLFAYTDYDNAKREVDERYAAHIGVPQPRNPAPDDTATGEYRVELQKSLTNPFAEHYVLLSPSGEELGSASTRWADENPFEDHASLLNTETRELRAQLQAAQAKNGRLVIAYTSAHDRANMLQQKLDEARGHIKDLEAAIQNAYKALASNGTNADKVHNAFSWLRDYVKD